jgi:RNA polymerase sigma-70 factor (ECF subfamily)
MKQGKSNIDEFRPMLFSIAYNMLGTVADAEDMVQETYFSWLNSDKSHVENTKFYLIRTVSNKCITYLKNLKKEREAYEGTWLPEPILSFSDAESNLKGEDKPSIGFMYMLERLTPIERGVMILKEAFNLDHSQIFFVERIGCKKRSYQFYFAGRYGNRRFNQCRRHCWQ